MNFSELVALLLYIKRNFLNEALTRCHIRFSKICITLLAFSRLKRLNWFNWSLILGNLCFCQLSERGQARLDQIEDAAEKVREFYRLVGELQGLLGKAEEGLDAQGIVGTEVEVIKQQLQEFKVGWISSWL